MLNPNVSVIVAVYNTEDYLDRCIQSLLNQTYQDFELLLVDDCSSDGSLEILRKYEALDERVVVITKDQNRGLSDTRNLGIQHARGNFFQFIDGDDYVEETLLEECVKAFEKQVDLVVFDIYQHYVSDDGLEIISHDLEENSLYCVRHHPFLITKMKNCAWNKMYRKELFINTNIRYPYGCCYEDLGTTYRILANAKGVRYIKKPLYHYIQDRPGNITSKFDRRVFDVLKMSTLNNEYYKEKGLYEICYEELKFLAGVNILECLKKTRNATDDALVEEMIESSFYFLKNVYPEFPKCSYAIVREKNDWIYANPTYLKIYLKLRRLKKKEG